MLSSSCQVIARNEGPCFIACTASGTNHMMHQVHARKSPIQKLTRARAADEQAHPATLHARQQRLQRARLARQQLQRPASAYLPCTVHGKTPTISRQRAQASPGI